MTNKSNLLLYTAGALVLLAFIYLLGASSQRVGAAAAVSPATVATSSNPTIGTTALTLFATSSCVARIITTYASPITLTFGDFSGQTPTGTFGHLQAASTTVVYEGGTYGCGLVKAFGFVSSAITVSETR